MAGLRDSSGSIVINEEAAEADIRKIQGAIAKLVEARKLLDPSKIDDEQMRGDIKDGYQSVLAKLTRDISTWEMKCKSTIQYIRSVVAKYQRIDREYARRHKG